MSKEFEDTLIDIYHKLDTSTFRINLLNHYFFVCGGDVDPGKTPSPSFRDRLLKHTSIKHPDIYNSLILAETFKDYFQENAYPDLLMFEEEIASICTLVIIFLESAGSLVELGLFCAKPDYYKKLLVIAPEEHVKSEDSFIYLGPLENLRKKDQSSVATYPWPSKKIEHYEADHLEDLCEIIQQKIDRIHKSEQFEISNSGHICFLIEEIIRISYPILIGEIELSMMALKLDISYPEISRKIYLLKKLKIIGRYEYSGNSYYYPLHSEVRYIDFSSSRTFDISKVKMALRKTFVLKEDSQSRKRRTALKEINRIILGEEK